MELLTQQDVLAHQAGVPWPSLRQVEQDLLLCRAMASIFNDRFLSKQVAMRGGTLLHKVYLAPPSRFSEDIDLVVFGDRSEDHIRKALRRVLAWIPQDLRLENHQPRGAKHNTPLTHPTNDILCTSRHRTGTGTPNCRGSQRDGADIS